MIGKGIKEIKNLNNNSKYYNLIADKAYKTKDEYKLNDKIIKIITPNKKNALKKNNKNENNKLKLRTKIENVNCFLKKYERIILRKDRKLKYFMSSINDGMYIE